MINPDHVPYVDSDGWLVEWLVGNYDITDATGAVIYTNLARSTRVNGYDWQHLSRHAGGFILSEEIARHGWKAVAK